MFQSSTDAYQAAVKIMGHDYANKYANYWSKKNKTIMSGKAKFKDLAEGKLTLPMIFLLGSLQEVEQKKIFKIIESGKFLKIKKVLEATGSFEKARHERQVALNRCIEYTERFIKLDKLDEIKIFINKILVA